MVIVSHFHGPVGFTIALEAVLDVISTTKQCFHFVKTTIMGQLSWLKVVIISIIHLPPSNFITVYSTQRDYKWSRVLQIKATNCHFKYLLWPCTLTALKWGAGSRLEGGMREKALPITLWLHWIFGSCIIILDWDLTSRKGYYECGSKLDWRTLATAIVGILSEMGWWKITAIKMVLNIDTKVIKSGIILTQYTSQFKITLAKILSSRLTTKSSASLALLSSLTYLEWCQCELGRVVKANKHSKQWLVSFPWMWNIQVWYMSLSFINGKLTVDVKTTLNFENHTKDNVLMEWL